MKKRRKSKNEKKNKTQFDALDLERGKMYHREQRRR